MALPKKCPQCGGDMRGVVMPFHGMLIVADCYPFCPRCEDEEEASKRAVEMEEARQEKIRESLREFARDIRAMVEEKKKGRANADQESCGTS